MDFQGDLASSLVGHAEAVVEGREGGSGLGDETWTGTVAYEDAAIGKQSSKNRILYI